MHVPAVLPQEEPARTASSAAARSCRRCARPSAGSRRRTSTCSSSARAAPARSWWPAPSTSTAAGPTGRSWPSTAPPFPETLLESELFGHEKGAFTGADRRRIGKFEQCRRRHPLPRRDRRHAAAAAGQDAARAAGAALRAPRRQRDGPDATCACWPPPTRTWRNCVDEGRFRKDLYYRLNVVTIRVPPLRERPGDVAELAHYFLFRFDRELGLDLRGFAPGGTGAAGSVLLARQRPRAASVRQAGDAQCLGPPDPAGVPARTIRANRPSGASPPTAGGIDRLIDGLMRAAKKMCTPA